MTAAEFSRPIAIDTLGEAPRAFAIEAEAAERAALAERFGLVEIAALKAAMTLRRAGEAVVAEGVVTAAVTQSCIASGVPVPARIGEIFSLQFRPLPGKRVPTRRSSLAKASSTSPSTKAHRSTSAKRLPRRWRLRSTLIPAHPTPRKRSRRRA